MMLTLSYNIIRHEVIGMADTFEFRGVYPPIPTAFDDAGGLAPDRLAHNVELWSATPLDGLVVLGSNGEFPQLTPDEKVKVLATVAEAIEEGKDLIAGTGCLSTRETIELTAEAAELGYDAAMVVTPYYYRPRMTEKVLLEYYEAVAAAADIPVILYNMPTFAGINMSVELVAQLAAHPNIVGIKDSAGNITQLAEYVQATPDSFAVMAGSGSFFLHGLMAGAHGGVMALANLLPWECCKLYELFEEENYAEARELQAQLVPVNQAVTANYSIPGLKAALSLHGYYGGPPRRPLLPLEKSELEELKGLLRESGFIGC
jgi:4-hydroxy-2-oxoglutarate aldolase